MERDLIFERCERYEKLAAILAAALRRMVDIWPETNQQYEEYQQAKRALEAWNARIA